MKLKTLLKQLKNVQARGPKEVTITGITSDSRRVAPGNIFVALKGINTDGIEYIPQAVENGASTILTDLFDPKFSKTCQIVHPEIEKIAVQLAKHYYREPDQQLKLIGITGTNGKTTTSYLIKHILDLEEKKCGLIGTIETIIGQSRFPAQLTTPDFLEIYKILHDMFVHGCGSCVMEASSHGIEQGRVAPFDFDVGIFTNLSPEHLDYHQTMENYVQSKHTFFEMLGKKEKKAKAILNNDDPYVMAMRENLSAEIWSYGIEKTAKVQAKNIELSPAGSGFDVIYNGKSVSFFSKLIGKYNVYNNLAAITMALSLGYELDHILDRLKTFSLILGRLEKVSIQKPFYVFVDFAHTEDALKNVLHALKQVSTGKIITVFGCGGDRDQQKRAKMGKVAEELSDYCVVTSDNPRSEDPNKIIQDILAGFSKKNYVVSVDRKEAIQTALEKVEKNDIILVAGRGHEQRQIFSNRSEKFNDVEMIQELAKNL